MNFQTFPREMNLKKKNESMFPQNLMYDLIRDKLKGIVKLLDIF